MIDAPPGPRTIDAIDIGDPILMALADDDTRDGRSHRRQPMAPIHADIVERRAPWTVDGEVVEAADRTGERRRSYRIARYGGGDLTRLARRHDIPPDVELYDLRELPIRGIIPGNEYAAIIPERRWDIRGYARHGDRLRDGRRDRLRGPTVGG